MKNTQSKNIKGNKSAEGDILNAPKKSELKKTTTDYDNRGNKKQNQKNVHFSPLNTDVQPKQKPRPLPPLTHELTHFDRSELETEEIKQLRESLLKQSDGKHLLSVPDNKQSKAREERRAKIAEETKNTSRTLPELKDMNKQSKAREERKAKIAEEIKNTARTLPKLKDINKIEPDEPIRPKEQKSAIVKKLSYKPKFSIPDPLNKSQDTPSLRRAIKDMDLMSAGTRKNGEKNNYQYFAKLNHEDSVMFGDLNDDEYDMSNPSMESTRDNVFNRRIVPEYDSEIIDSRDRNSNFNKRQTESELSKMIREAQDSKKSFLQSIKDVRNKRDQAKAEKSSNKKSFWKI